MTENNLPLELESYWTEKLRQRSDAILESINFQPEKEEIEVHRFFSINCFVKLLTLFQDNTILAKEIVSNFQEVKQICTKEVINEQKKVTKLCFYSSTLTPTHNLGFTKNRKYKESLIEENYQKTIKNGKYN